MSIVLDTETAIAWSNVMSIEFNESLKNKEIQRKEINRSVEQFLSRGGVIAQLPSLDDKTSQSLMRNIENHAEFQHLDSRTLAKSSTSDDGN